MHIALQTAIAELATADYLVNPAAPIPNESASVAIQLNAALEPLRAQMDLAWVGAEIARAFVLHPWLISFELNLWKESAMDDHGEQFMAYYANVRDVAIDKSIPAPEELDDGTGSVCQHRAEALLEAVFEDQEVDLCSAFIKDDVTDSVDLRLTRLAIGELLAASPISGIAVARRLWPDVVANHAAIPWSAVPDRASAASA